MREIFGPPTQEAMDKLSARIKELRADVEVQMEAMALGAETGAEKFDSALTSLSQAFNRMMGLEDLGVETPSDLDRQLQALAAMEAVLQSMRTELDEATRAGKETGAIIPEEVVQRVEVTAKELTKLQTALTKLVGDTSDFTKESMKLAAAQEVVARAATLSDVQLREMGLTTADVAAAATAAQRRFDDFVDTLVTEVQPAKTALEDLREAMEEVGTDIQRDVDDTASHLRAATDLMGDAIADFARTGKLDIKSLIDTMIAEILRLVLSRAFAQFLLALGSTSTTTTTTPSPAAGAAAARSQQGGPVNRPTQVRRVDPAVFVGAPRAQGGGLVLGRDEVPVIAHRGETILPAHASAQPVVNVMVEDRNNSDVQVSTTSRGKTVDILAIIERRLAQRTIEGGPMASAMQQTFGLRRQTVDGR